MKPGLVLFYLPPRTIVDHLLTKYSEDMTEEQNRDELEWYIMGNNEPSLLADYRLSIWT